MTCEHCELVKGLKEQAEAAERRWLKGVEKNWKLFLKTPRGRFKDLFLSPKAKP